MTGYKRVFLGCWVSIDEQDRLCVVSLDSAAVEHISDHPTNRLTVSSRRVRLLWNWINTLLTCLVRHHRVEVRREGDVPSVIVAPDANTPPQSPPQRPEKRPRPDGYTGMMTRSSSRTKRAFHRDIEVDLVRIPRKKRSTCSASQKILTTVFIHPGLPSVQRKPRHP
jgi:hypothetical protein